MKMALNVGAAVLSGDLAAPPTIIAARTAAPSFSWVVVQPRRHGKSSVDQESAIHNQGGSVNKAGVVRGQKRGCLANLFGQPAPT